MKISLDQHGYSLLSVAMGLALAIYLPILSHSGKIIGSPILANIPFYTLGLLTSFLLSLMMGSKLSDYSKLSGVPPWMFIAGVVSGLMILGTTFLIPRIGPGPFFVLMVTGQIIGGALLSHYGLLGAPLDTVTLKKIAGMALVVAGAYLVTMK